MALRSLLAACGLCVYVSAVSPEVVVDVSFGPSKKMDALSSSFSIDTTTLFGYTRTRVDLRDEALIQLAKNIGPAYIRFGGSVQDFVAFNLSGRIPPSGLPSPTGLHHLYMNASLWNSLVEFCDRAGLRMVYGVNAVFGRQQRGLVPANEAPEWDSSNARELLEYVKKNKQNVHAWELGNESNVYNCSSVVTNMTGAQMASEFVRMRQLVDELTPDTELWGPDPSLTGDPRGQCRSIYGADVTRFFAEVLEGAGKALDRVTWHYYSQYQGNDTSSAQVRQI